MKKILIVLLGIGLLESCNKEKFFDGPNSFQDQFEDYNIVDDMLVDNDVFWSFTQQTIENNALAIDSTRFHNGVQALRFYASKTTDGNASKASVVKQHMAFWEEETVRVSAWYFIEGNEDLDWLFLMDLEEQVAVGAGPGMRVALVDNRLLVEHKFNEGNIKQEDDIAIDFPRNEWVKIEWEVNLSNKDEGSVRLWQNAELIIDVKNARTLPRDFLYSQQGTKAMYSSVEIGITANSTDNDLTLWVDDFEVRVEE